VQAEALQHLLGVAREQLEGGHGVLRLHQPHELDLVELVLANEPAHVLAVAARFGAETGRVRGVRHGQLLGLEDLARVQVGDGHLGRGDEVERVLLVALGAARLEQVLLELRQLPRAVQRRRLHEQRRPHLGVALLLRVQIQHELDQRPLEARPAPHSTAKRAPESLAARSKSRMPRPAPTSQ
jgi:hypothetical protein